jgi:PAS domain S-box-containing protein
MKDAASFDAILQCNLLEVFCEALGAAIFVTDKLDEISFASVRLLHLFPIRESAITRGGRARDLYGALYDSGLRLGGERQAAGGREEWIAERIACGWKERVDWIEQAGTDRWMRVVSRRFSSGLGFVVIQDVSEQKKKENLLRSEQERVRLTEEILDTLPVAVAVKDRNLNYVAVNQEFCRLIGATREALLGHGSWDALSPELAGHIEQLDWHLLSSGEPGLANIVHRWPDGTTFELERQARRLGRAGSHFIAISLTEEPKSAAHTGPALEDFGAKRHISAGASLEAMPATTRNVLYLTEAAKPSQALKLALRAHGVDLCYVHDAIEFSAFLPAAKSAGVAVDLVLIDFGFDPAGFNIAARAGSNFRMLAYGAEESAALALILGALADAETPVAGHAAGDHSAGATDLVGAEDSAPKMALDVLAVEDSPINRMVLEQILSGLSLNFRIVGTAAEGLRECAALAPRLVLCDTTLPDVESSDLVLDFRHIDTSRSLVALVTSDSEENRRSARVAGFDYSLAKPLSAEALGALLSDLLAERPRMAVSNGSPSI